MRRKILHRPKYIRSGEPAYMLPTSYLESKHELLLSVSLVTHRYLFGLVYSGLLGDYFNRMPNPSGVYIALVVPTPLLNRDVAKPGDIDLLVVPYEGDELVLDHTMAVEIKVIRATFLKQGKSPNSLGMSQAAGLVEMGFPYVSVAHLIVSDESPEKEWRPMKLLRVVNSDGLCQFLPDVNVDCMPMDLMRRAIGKMQTARPNPFIGLAAVYLGSDDAQITGHGSTWHPETMPASPITKINTALLDRIADLLEKRPAAFMDIPRYDPM